MTRLNPYISFKDNTREAMEFYKSVFGGNLYMDTFEKFQVSKDPGENNKIMHAMLEADNGMILMAADTPNSMGYMSGNNVGISLSGDDEIKLRNYWDKLSRDATVRMPLEKAPWGAMFGMLTDKFGITWMVNIGGSQQ